MGSGAFEFKNQTIIANKALGQHHPPPITIFEDFDETAIALSPYASFTQTGTPTGVAEVSATAGDPVAGSGGWLAGATDDVDAEIDEVTVGGSATVAKSFRADQVGSGVLAVEWALSVPTALTARQYFAGVSDDAREGSSNGALNIQTAYTLVDTADDAAGFILSSLATTPTYWKWASTDSGTGSTMAVANDVLLAVANTWVGLRVEIDVLGDCYFSTRAKRGGSLTFRAKSNVGLSPDVLLVPYFSAAPTTTTAVPWELDYCFVAQDHAV